MVIIVKRFTVASFHGRFPDRAVHAFDLTIRPGVFDLGQPVLNLMLAAGPIKDMLEGINMPLVIGELDAIIPKVINNDSLVFRPEFIKPLTAFDQFRVFKGPMRQHPGPLVLSVSTMWSL